LTLTLSNPRADRIKAVAQLTGRSARSATGRFLVEGPQAVREAVRFAADSIRDLYVADDVADRHADVLAQAMNAGVFVHLGTRSVLDAMSGDAQGVVAVLDQPAVVAQLPPGAALVAILNNVRDPGNAGTAIRVADAAGADAVILTGESVEVVNPKVVRSTVGSLFHLPVLTGWTLADAIAACRAAGMVVLAADGEGTRVLGESGSISEADPWAKPTAWLFGNEAWGLSAEERALADEVVRIPLFGKAESLNLATAVSVCLYASALAKHRP